MLLGICINLSASAAPFIPSQTDEQAIMAQLLEKSNIQREAVAANAFFESNLRVDGEGELVYPKSFAGDYIDNEGNLIIQISSDDFSEYQYLRDKFSCVKFNRVKYSKEYLRNILDEYLDTCIDNGETLYRAYVDVELNRAVIEADEHTFSHKLTNDEKSPFLFKIGSPIYALSSLETNPESATSSISVTSGDLLTNKKSFFGQRLFSAGIGMINSAGKDIIISCGHGKEVNDKIYFGNTYIGDVTRVSFSDGALGDYSVITLNANASSTYNLYGIDSNSETNTYTISQNKGVYAPIKGEYVFKCTKNSGVAAFKVETVDVDVFVYSNSDMSETVEIKGQTAAGLMDAQFMGISGETVKPGDSGSGIFSHSFSGDYFSGIISSYDDSKCTLYYTPASRVLSFGNIKTKK